MTAHGDHQHAPLAIDADGSTGTAHHADVALAAEARRRRRQVPEGLPTREAIDALPEVLTRAQAAWLLQLSPQQLRAAAQRGQVPCSTFGRTMRFSKSLLLRRLEGHDH